MRRRVGLFEIMNVTEQIASDPTAVAAKLREMANLLVECRDALPAISMSSAKLRNIDLTLADRIEACLKPWEIKT